ncbi:MAG: hypothetical protein ABFR82_00320 [Nitrospirota bacterium]
MIYRIAVLTGFILLMLSVSVVAAEQKKSRLETDFGTSYKLQKFNQILNPDAEKNLAPVEGFNGRAAQKSVDKYLKKFASPQKDPVYSFSIGGAGKK